MTERPRQRLEVGKVGIGGSWQNQSYYYTLLFGLLFFSRPASLAREEKAGLQGHHGIQQHWKTHVHTHTRTQTHSSSGGKGFAEATPDCVQNNISKSDDATIRLHFLFLAEKYQDKRNFGSRKKLMG